MVVEGPQIGELTCLLDGVNPCLYNLIRTGGLPRPPPKRVTSPAWGAPSPCKEALNGICYSAPSSLHWLWLLPI